MRYRLEKKKRKRRRILGRRSRSVEEGNSKGSKGCREMKKRMSNRSK
jgi:hypothetical protein